MATVVLLVALRLSLGCHFLYEGVWKIKHHDEFTAEPFLTQAKGPLAGLFYAMLPDLNGRDRLRIEEDAKKKKRVNSDALAARWNDIRLQFLDYYHLSDKAAQEKLEKGANDAYNKYKEAADLYLAESLPEIEAYFGALDRWENDKERAQTAPFQQKRRWDKMQELRREAAGWITELENREKAFKGAMTSLLDEQEQLSRGPLPSTWNPLQWTRLQQINFAVTYALTAIGLCLMLGLCTRLAALGGAGFMCFVVMTTWTWPGIYPPDPPVVGHALLIGKDFIEMVALLVIASMPVGHWGGLDFFLYNLVIDPFLSKRIRK